ncbi:MAG: phenylalanine--tRNA ligase subunit beta, partial [Planctomycetes bacterium]|nr:phenylalanine--tRNA ligase subunit beta [Planctomycetota bacterium]
RLAKAELDDFDKDSGEARIELNDTNRPDLWSTEGLARQLRSHIKGEISRYDFFEQAKEAIHHIEVDPGLEKIRPFVAAFAVQGPPVTDAFLVQLIQTQEKLCENFGRKRRNIAIGIYEADAISFPVKYVAARAGDYSFTPLGCEEAWPLDRIVREHPKGKDYGHLLEGLEAYPLLTDSTGKVLSLPPIINSRETGEVKVGDRRLFVEATGSDMRQLVLAMNIMAANFADRGFEISPVQTRLPYGSGLGRNVTVPMQLDTRIELDVTVFSRIIGETFSTDDVVEALKAYGVAAEGRGTKLMAQCPPYRDDYLHSMDVVEDFAISRGYQNFEPEMPSRFTVGKLNSITVLTDRVRDQMVGLGFEEIFSNILTNPGDELERMCLEGSPIVAVDNVMTETYSVLRRSILPSLLRVEARSSKAVYPHKLFEAGEICLPAPDVPAGTKTEHYLAGLWASADSGFSEIHSVLDMLFFYLVKPYSLRPASFPFYFEGRSAEVLMGEKVVGHIGELHPEVLTRFHIQVPCGAFETSLNGIC